MAMRSRRVKNGGYLLALLPQLLFVIGVVTGYTWVAVLFFFAALPALRYLVGNDLSPPNTSPSAALLRYLRAVPRLYVVAWALILPWTIWTLSSRTFTPWEFAGLGVSFWIIVSLNTAVAHEMVHSGTRLDRMLGVALDASVGYFHFLEEHLSHHARTGHFVGGDAARPGESVYRYALARYLRTFSNAWEFENERLRKRRMGWIYNRLLGRVAIPTAIGVAFFLMAGWPGLLFYGLEAIGAAFSVQAITYLQHWGLSQLKTPELQDYGFSWEDGCWMQACVTLNHAYHGQHHLKVRLPYYKLSLPKGALCLPASYPVMFILSLYPPLFTRVMAARLARWRADELSREELAHEADCIGAAQVARMIKR